MSMGVATAPSVLRDAIGLGFCGAGWRRCKGGYRAVREYRGLLLCRDCWRYRKAIWQTRRRG